MSVTEMQRLSTSLVPQAYAVSKFLTALSTAITLVIDGAVRVAIATGATSVTSDLAMANIRAASVPLESAPYHQFDDMVISPVSQQLFHQAIKDRLGNTSASDLVDSYRSVIQKDIAKLARLSGPTFLRILLTLMITLKKGKNKVAALWAISLFILDETSPWLISIPVDGENCPSSETRGLFLVCFFPPIIFFLLNALDY